MNISKIMSSTHVKTTDPGQIIHQPAVRPFRVTLTPIQWHSCEITTWGPRLFFIQIMVQYNGTGKALVSNINKIIETMIRIF